MITVDTFVRRHNLTVGFMKADVEGFGLQVVRGAAETLVRDRPVLALSCYHDFSEMYNASIFLMNLLPNYHFEWHMENQWRNIFYELGLFGYPKEKPG
jgi:hypothetical protein